MFIRAAPFFRDILQRKRFVDDRHELAGFDEVYHE